MPRISKKDLAALQTGGGDAELMAPQSSATGLRCELPWPPSVNHYYVRTGGRRTEVDGVRVEDRKGGVFLKPQAREFRRRVASLLSFCRPLEGELELRLILQPPNDRHQYDIDNPLKAVMDALRHAGVMADDRQIRQLQVGFGQAIEDQREHNCNGAGRVEVFLESIAEINRRLLERDSR
jgi:crossover junction endodeoxyribonuclease RusA